MTSFPHAEVARWARGYRARLEALTAHPEPGRMRTWLRQNWPLGGAAVAGAAAVGATVDLATGPAPASSAVGVVLYGAAAAALSSVHRRRVQVRRRRYVAVPVPRRAIDMPAPAWALMAQLPHIGPGLAPPSLPEAVAQVRALEPGMDEETAQCLVRAAVDPAS